MLSLASIIMQFALVGWFFVDFLRRLDEEVCLSATLLRPRVSRFSSLRSLTIVFNDVGFFRRVF